MNKRYTFLIVVFCVSLIGYSKNDDCNRGDQNTTGDNDHLYIPSESAASSGAISADPNEIIGPTGFDDSIRWVSVNDVLNYTILFENDPEFASANAQKVDVRFTVDDISLLKQFGLGTYGFANFSWAVEDAPAAYQNRLDLRDTMQIYVDLSAGIDVTKKQAFWTFSSIDPETGLNPWQVDRGMLPVNDSTHVGEGFVSFSLKPYEDMETGDTLSIAANIVFDQNDTIPTNRWRNTIDAGMPVSHAQAVVDSLSDTLYHISMTASDDEGGSGLKRVHLYQANHFGIYEEFAVCPLDTVIDFVIEKGRQYKFYSIAEDNVGNREPLKEQPDFIINVNAAPTDLALSDTLFQDDIAYDGYIGELAGVDTEGETLSYSLSEGEGAIHNDLFQVVGTQLRANSTFKCADDSIFHIRLSTVDEGGLSFSKAFALKMNHVLVRPEPDTLCVDICQGDAYTFRDQTYTKAGVYQYRVDNPYMCDSLYVIQLAVHPVPETPVVTVEGDSVLVSSSEQGNQWFIGDTPIEGATSQRFVPTADGVYHVCLNKSTCYSAASNAFSANFGDDMDLTLNLSEGWNWISSNLKGKPFDEAKSFVAPFGGAVERLVGQKSEIINDPEYGMVGDLTVLSPSSLYKLKSGSDTLVTLSGHAYDPSKVTITLEKGWTWFGYVPRKPQSLNEALANLVPMENDVVKGYGSFATYTSGEWVGTLTSMTPGEGYMYHSGQQMAFRYPTSRIQPVEDSAPQLTSGNVASTDNMPHKYADNMPVIAQLYHGNSKLMEGIYTLKAYVGSECRGSGLNVADRIFLTVYGETAGETVTFQAVDNATGEAFSVTEKVEFGADMVGSYTSPFILHVAGKVTGITGEEASPFIVYPNPVRNRLYLSGIIASIQQVRIYSAGNGETLVFDTYDSKGLNVSSLPAGAYIVAVVTADSTSYLKFIKAE